MCARMSARTGEAIRRTNKQTVSRDAGKLMGTGRGCALALGSVEAPFHFESKHKIGVSGYRYSGQPHGSNESARAKTHDLTEGVNSA